MKLEQSLVYNRKALPGWARFWIELGRTVAQAGGIGRLAVGLALPTRAFAAALAGTGVVTGRLGPAKASLSQEEHFGKLCSLPAGTPLLYRRTERGATRELRSVFAGIDSISGEIRLRVQVENIRNGGLTHLIPIQHCLDITILDGEAPDLPMSQNGRPVENSSPFLEACLGSDLSRLLVTATQFDCLLVGQASILRDETIGTQYASPRKHYPEGALNEVLRIRRFQASTAPFRSDIFPVNGLRREKGPSEMIPAVVIFDGARGFLRWRERWPSSHWLVMLDRTEADCQDAVDLLNQKFQYRSADGDSTVLRMRLPAGTEMLAYREGQP